VNSSDKEIADEQYEKEEEEQDNNVTSEEYQMENQDKDSNALNDNKTSDDESYEDNGQWWRLGRICIHTRRHMQHEQQSSDTRQQDPSRQSMNSGRIQEQETTKKYPWHKKGSVPTL